MKAATTLPPGNADDEIAALVETLLVTEQRLVDLTAGEIDSVSGKDGRAFLLQRAQEQLRHNEAAKQAAILNALPAHIALLDAHGIIVSVNDAWRRFGRENGFDTPDSGLGLNYAKVCDDATGRYMSEAHRVGNGIRDVLAGREKNFSIEYPCHAPTAQRWFVMSVTPLAPDTTQGAVVMHVNITSRKQGEMASARLAALVESSQDAIIGKNLESVITSWNSGAEKIFGYTASEMLGTSILRLNPQDQPDEHHHILARIRRGENVGHFDTMRQTKDRRLIDISVTASPIKDGVGEVIGVSIVARDITSRRLVENALHASQASMAAAQQIAHFGSWELDLDNADDIDVNPLRWSDEMFRIAGLEPSAVEMTSELFFEIVPAEEHEAIRQAVATAISERRQYSIVHRFILPDGNERVVQETAQIFFEEKSGRPLKIVGTAHDITERKRAETALLTSEARYRSMLQGVEAGVIVRDADLQIKAFNPKAAELLGVDGRQMDAQTLSGPQWQPLRADGTAFPDAELPHRKARSSRKPVRDTIVGLHRAASADLVWLLVNANPALNARGEVEEVITTLVDVTARIHAEQTLQRQQNDLQVLFDLIPAMIWFKDTENRILRVNQKVAAAAGKSVVEIEGKPSQEIYPNEAAKYYADDLELIRSGQSKLGIVEVVRDSTGQEAWVETDKVPVRDKAGKVVGIFVMAQDITERTRATALLVESRRRLTLATESAHLGIWEWDVVTNKLVWDAQMYALYGIREQDFTGAYDAWQNGLHPEDRKRSEVEIFAALDAVDGFHTEFRVVWPSGEVREIEAHALVERASDGSSTRMVGVNWDITDRKRTAQVLRESEERFRFLNDLAEATRMLLDPAQIMAVTARILAEHLGASRCAYATVEPDGDRFTILHDYTDGCASTVGQYQLSLFGAQAVTTLNCGQPLIIRNVDTELPPGEGAAMFNAIGIKAIISCPLVKEGVLRAMIAVHQTTPRDWQPGEIALVQEVVERCWAQIERRSAEERLRQSENLLRIAGRAARLGGWSVTLPAVRAIWSDEVCAIHEVPSGTVPGLEQALGFYAPASRSVISEAFATCVQEGTPFDLELDVVTAKGRPVRVRSIGEAQRNDVGTITGVQGAFQDISEHKRTVDALQASEQRFKALFEQAAVGVAQVDATTGRFVHVNQRFCEITGRSLKTLEQTTLVAITHPSTAGGDVEAMRQLNAGTIREFTREKRFVRGDLSEVWINLTVSAMWAVGEAADYFVVIAQDITGQKLLEEQYRQAQKLEAIGTLAGGIAHDFNNVLAAVNGYTELAKREVRGNATVTSYLDSVLNGAKRATDLVRQILAFSRQQALERKPIQLREVVAEALALLRATIPATIEFETSLSVAMPNVLADASQIHQVVMNLCTNAAQAMKDLPGRLTVKLEEFRVDSSLATTRPGLAAGLYVRMLVSDTGSGMDEATQRRIFEPFFTTKAPGEGTGLGLAVVHGIMQSHDGAVTVYSHLGEGTTFHLYFPAHTQGVTEALGKKTSAPFGTGERILYLDDEQALATMGKRILENLGYVVDVHTKPVEALAAFSAKPQEYDLVVTDQMMPSMTGLSLAEKVHAIRANLPIILTTGYSATLTTERVQAMGIRKLLLKPLTFDALGAAVHQVLTERKTH